MIITTTRIQWIHEVDTLRWRIRKKVWIFLGPSFSSMPLCVFQMASSDYYIHIIYLIRKNEASVPRGRLWGDTTHAGAFWVPSQATAHVADIP